jgi:enoyl-CoA hydratase
MEQMQTVTYEVDERVARITLNRPHRGNAITLAMPRELAECVELACLNPSVHVIALQGSGPGFCSGYDLVEFAEQSSAEPSDPAFDGTCLDLDVQRHNHDSGEIWDPMIDYAMMHRNVRGFMSLFHSEKPVICKIHGFCIGGGTDLALCCDLIVIEERAKIGYPPARVWGAPTTGMWIARIGLERAKRLLLTGDCITGSKAAEWGLATEAAPTERLDERFETWLQRIASMPINQLTMMKLLLNQSIVAHGLMTTQLVGTLFDGIARHTKEGYAFQQTAAQSGFKQAVRERDSRDFGRSNE